MAMVIHVYISPTPLRREENSCGTIENTVKNVQNLVAVKTTAINRVGASIADMQLGGTNGGTEVLTTQELWRIMQ